MLKRVAKLESLICPESDGNISITLEELCRLMWRRNKEHFRKIAEDSNYPFQLFVYRFQREDAEAASRQRGTTSHRPVRQE